MISIDVDFGELERLQEALIKAPQELDGVLVSAMEEAEDVVYLKMTEAPPSMNYPPSEVKWDSQKQRRAYHYSSGFGGGDPYIRNGALAGALEESTLVMPGLVQGKVYSVEEWVKFVKSSDPSIQSTIHQGRWDTIEQDKEAVQPEVIDIITEAVKENLPRILAGK